MGNGNALNDQHEGVVFRKHLGYYTVRDGDRAIMCSVSSKLRKDIVYGVKDRDALRRQIIAVKDAKTDAVAVGDRVVYRRSEDGTGVIGEVLPRKSCLCRPDPGGGWETTMAANVDAIVAVFAAAKPEPKWGMLDRYLAFAEANDIPPIVCITKMDIADRAVIESEAAVYEKIGYRVLFSSAETGEGLDGVRDALADRVSVLVGKSGVGKTSLLNAIEPELGLRVNQVSESTGKGKHTTTHMEMFDLSFGGSIVDTPGVREFAVDLGKTERSLAELFPEMRPYIGQCRFGMDCTHTHEPGCAIKSAVEGGDIAYRRFESYLRMR